MSGGTHHTSTDYRFAPIPEALVFDPALSGNAVRVYAILARHGMDPGSCYPSHRRIGELSGLSQRSIPRLLTDLAEAGWVTIIHRFTPSGDPDSNAYQVHVDAQVCAGSTQESGEGYTRESAPKESNLKEELRDGLFTGEQEPQEPPRDQPSSSSEQALKPERAAFEDWYEIYPRKVGRPGALRAWKTRVEKTRVEPNDVIAGLLWWRIKWAEDKTPRDFMPYPATWLNDERWKDAMPANDLPDEDAEPDDDDIEGWVAYWAAHPDKLGEFGG